MNISDAFLGPLFFILVMVIGTRVRNRHFRHIPEGRYFMPGLTVKLIGSVIAGLLYTFFMGGGDTYHYYKDSTKLWAALMDDPAIYIKMLFHSGGEFDPDTHYYSRWVVYYNNPTAYFVVKITSLISIISFNNYTATSILFAGISFVGVWSLYLTLVDVYPKLYKKLAIAILFIPSVFFWGSGLFKDTINLGCLSFLTFAFYNLFIKRRRKFLSIALIIFCSYIIYNIKLYILLSFLPGLFFWIILYYKTQLNTRFLRFASTPLLLLMAVGFSFLFVSEIGGDSSRFSIEKFAHTAETMQLWHGHISGKEGGSGYSLGNVEKGPMGMIKAFPAAVNVTLFRPYLWEAKNLIMMLAALESTVIFIFTVWVLIQARVYKIITFMNRSSVIFFCLFFSLFFAFAVGFSSYNFGALSRYKIPCLPFYVAALFMIQYHLKEGKGTKFGSRKMLKSFG